MMALQKDTLETARWSIETTMVIKVACERRPTAARGRPVTLLLQKPAVELAD
jgi:hypothetical protein